MQELGQILKLFLLLLIVGPLNAAITAGQTQISSSRNSYRSSICSYYSGNYTDSDRTKSQSYINSFSYLSESEIESILFGHKFTTIATNTILLASPHGVSFLILFLLWPALCCCCTCPEKHPACIKCRKPEKQMYTKCELKWTAYLAIIAFLVVAVGSILAMISGSDLIKYVNDVGCKSTSLPDDFIWGRLSSQVNNRFFVGVSPLSSQMGVFQSKLNTFYSQSSNSLNLANNVRSQQNFVELSINNTYQSYSTVVYQNAFSSDGITFQNVSSAFKTGFYGPPSNSSTILGSIYSNSELIFSEINSALDPMIAAWNDLSSTTQSGISTLITNTITQLNLIATNMNVSLNAIGPFFNNSDLWDKLILGIKIYYGLFFGFSILATLALIILACCSVVKIRFIAYCSCGFLTFLSLISFLILVILAIVSPTLGQVCAYTDTQFKTGSKASTYFTNLGFQHIGSLIPNCMPTDTGSIIDQINPAFNTSFNHILTISQNVLKFNSLVPDYSTTNLLNPFLNANALVTNLKNAVVLDVVDPVSLSFFDRLRTINFTIGVGCNTINVGGDSWMPSFNLYSCPGGKAKLTPCSNLASTSAGACPLGCYEIMQEMESASGDASYATSLQSRYNAGCNYYTYVKNLQDNWNVPRRNDMNSVSSSLSSLQTKVLNYDTTMKGVQANVSAFTTTLNSNFDQITNLDYGTFNGVDCRTIAESILDLRDSVCVGVLNSLNYNMLCLILISYGVLLGSCLATCAGVRHFKHLQKMQVQVGYKGVPVSISDQRFDEKDN